ncbi:MAG: DNA alkylation repair protein [Candidatus Planktophila sp.]|nr:DNA alkylation repair protein [Candidatus Planktophila sp.]
MGEDFNQVITARRAIIELRALGKPGRVHALQHFYKTAPGGYGEGDVFLGLSVPQSRLIAKAFRAMELSEIEKLLASKFHEVRLCGLIILTIQFKASKEVKKRREFFNFYLKQLKLRRVNNWDLVDVSAPTIGEYLLEVEDPLPTLIKLARSSSLWERRSAILFTFPFIRAGHFAPTLEISKLLLKDKHDLIHKASGWMLRELGKRDLSLLRSFLSEHSVEMPRTMLRYSIEKLPETERQKWLKKIK